MIEGFQKDNYAILLCAGGAPAPAQLPEELTDILAAAGAVCAADSGYLHASLFNLKIDFLVGDMDSLTEHGINYRNLDIPYQLYPDDKDKTDEQLALHWLQSQGYRDIIRIGGGSGGAIDHLFALYHNYFSTDQPAIWLSDLGQTYLVNKALTINGQQGARLGVFALESAQLKSKGLRYPLDDLNWNSHQHCSSCNIIDEQHAEITVVCGRVLITVSYR